MTNLEAKMNPFPMLALLRRDAVLLLTGFTADELQSEIDKGLFPPPIKLTPDEANNALGWNSHEVQTLNAAKIGGASLDEVRKLVAGLVDARKQLTPPRKAERHLKLVADQMKPQTITQTTGTVN